MKVLLWGKNGWLGASLAEMLERDGHQVIRSDVRLEDYAAVIKALEEPELTHCVMAAGLTGRPNIDWCEDHHHEVLRVNVIATSMVADLCYRKGIHLTVLATGCIYEYDSEHPIGGAGFTENDRPNFAGSYYSKTKIWTESIIKEFPTTLVLRIRMPLSDDLHERNFITKIKNYQKVINVPNSMTVLYDLVPLIPDMMSKMVTGVFNFTNPGVISHNQILDLYRKYIDPDFTYTNFSVDEQAKILKAGRSNNCLDASKLLSLYPNIPPIESSIVKLFERMQQNLGVSKKR
jgi:3,5-epimerase/4-reductase